MRKVIVSEWYGTKSDEMLKKRYVYSGWFHGWTYARVGDVCSELALVEDETGVMSVVPHDLLQFQSPYHGITLSDKLVEDFILEYQRRSGQEETETDFKLGEQIHKPFKHEVTKA